MGSSTAFRSELAGLCASICDDNASPGKVMRACESLFDLLCRVSGLNLKAESARNSTLLPQGKAIGPAWAAHCILDFMRTRAFLRGTLQALTSREGGHVLYAGTGPFAALLLPLLPFFPFEHFRFTLIDVHPANLAALRRLLRSLAVPEHLFQLVEADATQFHCETPADLLILELMQAGLAEEPQVAAMLQLGPQLCEGGVLIPQKVKVETALRHSRRDRARMLGMEPGGPVLHPLGLLMELDAGAVPALIQGFPELVFELPAKLDPEFNQLVLLTEIQVWGDEWLGYSGSALTEAIPIIGFEAGKRAGKVAFKYQTGEHPGFLHRFLP